MFCREITSKLAKIFNFKYIEKLAFVSVVSVSILLISFLFFSPLALADDTFGCFDANVCGEKSLSSSTKYIINRDYDISISRRGSDVTILSFHGGCIEPYTSEISQGLAEQYEWNRYDLKGHIKGTSIPDCYKEEKQQKKNFRILHITSTNFDDPEAISLVEKHPMSVSIHGYSKERDTKPGYMRGTICVGGGNKAQVKKFREYINKSRLALPYPLIPVNARGKDKEEDVCNKLQGTKLKNIVNKNGSGKGGLQLELSSGMRQDLANLDDVKFNSLRDVVYRAVAQAMAD
jgi:phage replication-related protein YjqB (UPF0714/DUF867 family)